MRKIFCLVTVCILVWGFILASNVSAITKAKIVGTEWEVTGGGKMYDATTGDYLGAFVGAFGIVTIGETDLVSLSAPLVMSGAGSIAGANAVVTGFDYTLSGDNLTCTSGSILITHPVAGTIEDYTGPIEFKMRFTTGKTFKAKMSYINNGVETVLKVTGKKLGKLPPLL